MSIEVSKKENKQKKTMLSLNFGAAGNKNNNFILISGQKPIQKTTQEIKPDTPKDMEPEKKKDIEPKIWLYHEALLEAHNRGIRNRCHTPNSEENGKDCYYCPLACVTQLLKLCKPARYQHQKAKQYDHYVMKDKVYAKIQFVEDFENQIRCKTCEIERGVGEAYTYVDEPHYSVHLASYHRIRENDVVARMLKEELYDGKEERKMHHDPKFVQMTNNSVKNPQISAKDSQKALT